MAMTGTNLQKMNSSQIPEADSYGGRMHITLKYVTDHWEVKDHTAAEPAFVTLGAATTYTLPKCKWRGVNISNGTETSAVLGYDKEKAGVSFLDIEEPLVCKALHPIWPVKINLSKCTQVNGVQIHIHG
jgi:hypothetical protein